MSPKGDGFFAHHASQEYFRGHHNQTPVHGAIETHDRGTKGVYCLSGQEIKGKSASGCNILFLRMFFRFRVSGSVRIGFACVTLSVGIRCKPPTTRPTRWIAAPPERGGRWNGDSPRYAAAYDRSRKSVGWSSSLGGLHSKCCFFYWQLSHIFARALNTITFTTPFRFFFLILCYGGSMFSSNIAACPAS